MRKIALALFLLSACGQVTAYQTTDDAGTTSPDTISSPENSDLKIESAQPVDSVVETTPETAPVAIDTGPATADTGPPAVPCEIVIGPSPWPDECQSFHASWCNSLEINAALQNPTRLESKSYKGTCEPGCYDNGKYLGVQEVCHDGTVCQLTTVAPAQKQPLCKH